LAYSDRYKFSIGDEVRHRYSGEEGKVSFIQVLQDGALLVTVAFFVGRKYLREERFRLIPGQVGGLAIEKKAVLYRGSRKPVGISDPVKQGRTVSRSLTDRVRRGEPVLEPTPLENALAQVRKTRELTDPTARGAFVPGGAPNVQQYSGNPLSDFAVEQKASRKWLHVPVSERVGAPDFVQKYLDDEGRPIRFEGKAPANMLAQGDAAQSRPRRASPRLRDLQPYNSYEEAIDYIAQERLRLRRVIHRLERQVGEVEEIVNYIGRRGMLNQEGRWAGGLFSDILANEEPLTVAQKKVRDRLESVLGKTIITEQFKDELAGLGLGGAKSGATLFRMIEQRLKRVGPVKDRSAWFERYGPLLQRVIQQGNRRFREQTRALEILQERYSDPSLGIKGIAQLFESTDPLYQEATAIPGVASRESTFTAAWVENADFMNDLSDESEFFEEAYGGLTGRLPRGREAEEIRARLRAARMAYGDTHADQEKWVKRTRDVRGQLHQERTATAFGSPQIAEAQQELYWQRQSLGSKLAGKPGQVRATDIPLSPTAIQIEGSLGVPERIGLAPSYKAGQQQLAAIFANQGAAVGRVVSVGGVAHRIRSITADRVILERLGADLPLETRGFTFDPKGLLGALQGTEGTLAPPASPAVRAAARTSLPISMGLAGRKPGLVEVPMELLQTFLLGEKPTWSLAQQEAFAPTLRTLGFPTINEFSRAAESRYFGALNLLQEATRETLNEIAKVQDAFDEYGRRLPNTIDPDDAYAEARMLYLEYLHRGAKPGLSLGEIERGAAEHVRRNLTRRLRRGGEALDFTSAFPAENLEGEALRGAEELLSGRASAFAGAEDVLTPEEALLRGQGGTRPTMIRERFRDQVFAMRRRIKSGGAQNAVANALKEVFGVDITDPGRLLEIESTSEKLTRILREFPERKELHKQLSYQLQEQIGVRVIGGDPGLRQDYREMRKMARELGEDSPKVRRALKNWLIAQEQYIQNEMLRPPAKTGMTAAQALGALDTDVSATDFSRINPAQRAEFARRINPLIELVEQRGMAFASNLPGLEFTRDPQGALAVVLRQGGNIFHYRPTGTYAGEAVLANRRGARIAIPFGGDEIVQIAAADFPRMLSEGGIRGVAPKAQQALLAALGQALDPVENAKLSDRLALDVALRQMGKGSRGFPLLRTPAGALVGHFAGNRRTAQKDIAATLAFFRGDNPFIGLDIEVNTLTDEITEIAAARFVGTKGRGLALKGKGEEAMLRALSEFLEKNEGVVAGHNIRAYDIPRIIERARRYSPELASALEKRLGQQGVVDTMLAAAAGFPGEGSYALESLIRKHVRPGLTESGELYTQTHGAAADVKDFARFLRRLRKEGDTITRALGGADTLPIGQGDVLWQAAGMEGAPLGIGTNVRGQAGRAYQFMGMVDPVALEKGFREAGGRDVKNVGTYMALREIDPLTGKPYGRTLFRDVGAMPGFARSFAGEWQVLAPEAARETMEWKVADLARRRTRRMLGDFRRVLQEEQWYPLAQAAARGEDALQAALRQGALSTGTTVDRQLAQSLPGYASLLEDRRLVAQILKTGEFQHEEIAGLHKPVVDWLRQFVETEGASTSAWERATATWRSYMERTVSELGDFERIVGRAVPASEQQLSFRIPLLQREGAEAPLFAVRVGSQEAVESSLYRLTHRAAKKIGAEGLLEMLETPGSRAVAEALLREGKSANQLLTSQVGEELQEALWKRHLRPALSESAQGYRVQGESMREVVEELAREGPAVAQREIESLADTLRPRRLDRTRLGQIQQEVMGTGILTPAGERPLTVAATHGTPESWVGERFEDLIRGARQETGERQKQFFDTLRRAAGNMGAAERSRLRGLVPPEWMESVFGKVYRTAPRPLAAVAPPATLAAPDVGRLNRMGANLADRAAAGGLPRGRVALWALGITAGLAVLGSQFLQPGASKPSDKVQQDRAGFASSPEQVERRNQQVLKQQGLYSRVQVMVEGIDPGGLSPNELVQSIHAGLATHFKGEINRNAQVNDRTSPVTPDTLDSLAGRLVTGI
jgi:hypothetical protein